MSIAKELCIDCKTEMDCKPGSTCDVYTCPSCGYMFYGEDYELNDDDEDSEWDSIVLQAYDDDVPPKGCRACGGPYPQCKSSCGLFGN